MLAIGGFVVVMHSIDIKYLRYFHGGKTSSLIST
jgi:hypothetical protein